MRLVVVVACLALPGAACAQPATDSLGSAIYYERISDSLVRFFYDRHYYLVDQDCHYKEIEREGNFDFEKRQFDGPVRDYDLDGYLVMEGNYVDGKKEGLFRGYHTSGYAKWELRYEADRAVDTVRYFYPDGRPYLEYLVGDGDLLLWSYWNAKGRQRVTEGRGRFELVSEASDNYNEIGYRWVQRRGKVRDGKMHQDIFYRYVFEDGSEYTAGVETYHMGEFVRGEDYSTGVFTAQPLHPLGPRIWHVRSEALVSKRCNVDEHVGFTHYAADIWQQQLGRRAVIRTLPSGEVEFYLVDGTGNWVSAEIEPTDVAPRTLSFALQVDKEGNVQTVEAVRNFDTPLLADHMLAVVRDFRYWVPSWDGNAFVDDELTVNVRVHPGLASFFVLYDMHVIREHGS